VGPVGDAEHGSGGSGVAVGRELPLLHVWAAGAGKATLAYFFWPADEYDRVRAEAAVHVVGLLAGDGIAAGYLAEQQKHLRAEKAGVTRMLSKVRVDAGLTGTLQQISREIVSMYGAARL
jgi:hypothetical protein